MSTTIDGTEIAVFPGMGAGALFVTEDPDRSGYTFRIKGRRNHFTISEGEAIELARTILDRFDLPTYTKE